LATLSREYGLNWAANVIIGHPGETARSMKATHTFLQELFTSAAETCGWLSVDPFRIYPGSDVHERLDDFSERFGSRFYHPRWWTSWYDAGFRAEHLDPSAEIDFAARVSFMYESYGPLISDIIGRFRGQGRSVDRIFARSLEEQAKLISPAMRDVLLDRARWVERSIEQKSEGSTAGLPAQALSFPIGLQVKDPTVRRREDAVRRMLERGILRSEALIEALLCTAPEPYLSEDEIKTMFSDDLPQLDEGELPPYLGISYYALALEAINPGPGQRAVDLLACRGYITALLAELVGESGEVIALCPTKKAARSLKASFSKKPQVRALVGDPTTCKGLDREDVDALFFGAALPHIPTAFTDALTAEGGRLATVVGPRFGLQDLLCITRSEQGQSERLLAHVRLPIAAGANGWLKRPRGGR